jgi:hypothetical protein
MSKEGVDESMVRADRWSKVIALLSAIGLFVLATRLIDDAQFSMIIAAFAGIGVRLYIPYHASITVARDDTPIQEHEGTGNYHQGAAGVGILIAALGALLARVSELGSWRAYAAGAAIGLAAFLVLRIVLPG